jgi:bis(5'-nucleosidyl)-tetraphosphatase
MSESPTDFSCGVIPWRQLPGQAREYLLVQHNAGHWAFPKGHPEDGESHLQTARRELAEETGITAVTLLESPTFDEIYDFRDQGGNWVHKTVRYFLGAVDPAAETPVLQIEEVQAAVWVDAPGTRRMLSFDEGRSLLDAAEEHLAP